MKCYKELKIKNFPEYSTLTPWSVIFIMISEFYITFGDCWQSRTRNSEYKTTEIFFDKWEHKFTFHLNVQLVAFPLKNVILPIMLLNTFSYELRAKAGGIVSFSEREYFVKWFSI